MERDAEMRGSEWDLPAPYKLKGGEYVRGGILHGWTGQKCAPCKGYGETNDDTRCPHCGGTGDEHGVMPVQPPNLPEDTD